MTCQWRIIFCHQLKCLPFVGSTLTKADTRLSPILKVLQKTKQERPIQYDLNTTKQFHQKCNRDVKHHGRTARL